MGGNVPEKNKGGRPPHEPTEELRKKVSNLAKLGFNQIYISNACGFSPDTLQKYYQKEYRDSRTKAHQAVAKSLWEKAVKDKDTASIIFYCKTQLGWKDTTQLELTGEGGGPIQIAAINAPRQENRDEWLKKQKDEEENVQCVQDVSPPRIELDHDATEH